MIYREGDHVAMISFVLYHNPQAKKMRKKPYLLSDFADILRPPEKVYRRKTGFYVIGDLHGNALKLLYFLCKIGIVNCSEVVYKQFVELYYTPVDQLTPEHMRGFEAILSYLRGSISPSKDTVHPHLIFAGDETGDRGANDYFTLKLLHALNRRGVNYNIVLSNHGFEFIQAYETQTFTPLVLGGGYVTSLLNLKEIMDKELVSRYEVLKLIYEVYRPFIVPCFFYNDTYVTHAPVGKKVIDNVKKDLIGLSKLEGSYPKDLGNLNLRFQTFYAESNRIHTLAGPNAARCGSLKFRVNQDGNPYELLMWNRCNYDTERPRGTYWIHGHAGDKASRGNVINLDWDNYLGKSPTFGMDHTGTLNLAWIPPLCT